jgi:choline dehydrogenase-like flavoprotein
MSADPETGVIDSSGRSHDIQNLWISDNSTFPSSLSANPCLTQMALSLRTADLMLR